MAKGAFYPVYNQINLYSNAAQAQAYGSNYSSTISPNTGSDSGSYNAVSSVEGKGNCYVDTSVGMTAYYPAFPIWWVPNWGGSGYAIGWTNDSKNLGYSKPTLSTSSVEAGKPVTIYTNLQNSSFTHILYFKLSTQSNWTTIVSGVTTSYAWRPDVSSICSMLPNSTSGNFAIMCETYKGSTYIGMSTVPLTITIPASIVPSISAPTVTETNTVIKNTLGYTGFVSGISTYSVLSSTRTAGQGSTVSRIQYKLGTYSYQDPPSLTTARTFGTMTGTSILVYAFIVDARGRTATSSTTITQTAYNAPTISSLAASRYNPEDKTQAQIELKATQTKLSNKNTIRYKLEYKKSTETAWKQLKAYSAYQTSDLNITTVQTIANDAKYNIRVTVQDLIGVEISSIITLANTERKWLRVVNGEDIDVIGNLLVNGNSLLKNEVVNSSTVTIAAGSYASVSIPYDPPNGYGIAGINSYADAGCMANAYYGSNHVFGVMIFNPTTVSRTPRASINILLRAL